MNHNILIGTKDISYIYCSFIIDVHSAILNLSLAVGNRFDAIIMASYIFFYSLI